MIKNAVLTGCSAQNCFCFDFTRKMVCWVVLNSPSRMLILFPKLGERQVNGKYPTFLSSVPCTRQPVLSCPEGIKGDARMLKKEVQLNRRCPAKPVRIDRFHQSHPPPCLTSMNFQMGLFLPSLPGGAQLAPDACGRGRLATCGLVRGTASAQPKASYGGVSAKYQANWLDLTRQLLNQNPLSNDAGMDVRCRGVSPR